MIDQEKIHKLCISKDRNERLEAIEQLRCFSSQPNKLQAWNDLYRLTYDKDTDVRHRATEALVYAISQVPDRQQVWNDLLRLINDEDKHVRDWAVYDLVSLVPHMPDKQQVWNDLLRLVKEEDVSIRYIAAEALVSAISQVPDKQQAWNELIQLTNDKASYVKCMAAKAIVSAFSQLPDKKLAWNDLHKLTHDKESYVRSKAAKALSSAFSQILDKQEILDDLHRLINDEDRRVRDCAAETLFSAFSDIPDKQQAWNDLLFVIHNDDSHVGRRAANALGSYFVDMPDKQQSWNDLLTLTQDENNDVRSKAADAISSAFFYTPDKLQAWSELIRLTYDEDHYVRIRAIEALVSVLSQFPDKQLAWNDLIRLTNNEVRHVRYRATEVLGSTFSAMPDKQQAWNDLLRLTYAEDCEVRTSSNHSLGRVSIFMASQAETDEDYKKELEKAIQYFEIAVKEFSYYNPAQFCLPFYRSFYTILFTKQKAKVEMNKYMEEAKSAIEGSKNKEMLFEAVENLAKALEEVHNLGNLDLQAKKGKLDFYRIYCDRAAEIMNDTNEKAPFATEVLRKGLPILDKKLKVLLEEIQEKAKIACNESKGTATEEIACAVSKEVLKWEISNQEEMTQKVEDVAYLFKTKIASLPENEFVLNKIEAMRSERNISKQYEALLFVIGQIPTVKVVSEQELDRKLLEFREDIKGEIVGAKEEVKGEIVSAKEEIINEIVNIKDKLCCISFNVSNIGLNSYNIISNLDMIRVEMEKLQRISNSNMSSLEVSDSKLTEQLNALNNILQDRWKELERLIGGLAKDDDTKKILSTVNELKQSKLGKSIQTPSSIATLIGFLIQAIQLCQQCKLI